MIRKTKTTRRPQLMGKLRRYPLGCVRCKSPRIVPEFTAELITQWTCDDCGHVMDEPQILSQENWIKSWKNLTPTTSSTETQPPRS